MARPPIIISNGGIVSKLTEGVWETSDRDKAEKRLMKNVKDLKGTSVIKIIKTKKDEEAYCLYWRLDNDAVYEEAIDEETKVLKYKDGKETISINDLLDPYN